MEAAELYKKFVEAVFSQAGLVGLGLLIALVWQTRELGKERKAHEATRGKLDSLSEKSIAASTQTLETLASIRMTIEMFINGRLRK